MSKLNYDGCAFNATRFDAGRKTWERWRTDKQAAAEAASTAVGEAQRAGAEARRAMVGEKAGKEI